MQALQRQLGEACRAKELAAIPASKEVPNFAADKVLGPVGHRFFLHRACATWRALSRRWSAASCLARHSGSRVGRRGWSLGARLPAGVQEGRDQRLDIADT